MRTNPKQSGRDRVGREVERELRERVLNDEARAGLARLDELRIKDARQNPAAATLRRTPAR